VLARLAEGARRLAANASSGRLSPGGLALVGAGTGSALLFKSVSAFFAVFLRFGFGAPAAAVPKGLSATNWSTSSLEGGEVLMARFWASAMAARFCGSSPKKGQPFLLPIPLSSSASDASQPDRPLTWAIGAAGIRFLRLIVGFFMLTGRCAL
jgi:hypothetical protein